MHYTYISLLLSFFLTFLSPLTAQTYFNKVVQSDTAILSYIATVPIASGFLAIGPMGSTHVEAYALSKISDKGEVMWSKYWIEEGYEANLESKNQFQATPDGQFIVALNYDHAVTNQNKIVVIKFDKEGNTIWKQTYHENKRSQVNGITPIASNDFLLWGFERSDTLPEAHAFLLQGDHLGRELWEQTYLHNLNSAIINLVPTPDQGYLLHSCFSTLDFSQHVTFLIKADSLGNGEWSQMYGEDWHNEVHVCKRLPNNNYLLMGQQLDYPFVNTTVNYISEIAQDGTVLWEKSHQFPFRTRLNEAYITPSGGILAAGHTPQDGGGSQTGVLVKYKPNGDFVWYQLFNDGTAGINRVASYLSDLDVIPNTNGNGLLLTGYRLDPSRAPFTQTGWVIRTDTLGTVCAALGCDSVGDIVDAIAHPFLVNASSSLLTTYPNPATHILYVTLSSLPTPKQNHQLILRDLQGRLVHQQTLSPTSTIDIAIPTRQLPTGMYLLSVEQKGVVLEQQKVVITH